MNYLCSCRRPAKLVFAGSLSSTPVSYNIALQVITLRRMGMLRISNEPFIYTGRSCSSDAKNSKRVITPSPTSRDPVQIGFGTSK